MLFVSFYRVFKFAAKNFWRNFWLAVVNTTILSMSLFVATILLALNLVINHAVHTLHEQVDVSVYFKPDVTEQVVQDFQKSLLSVPGVREVIFVSKDEALDNFRTKYEDNEIILDTLNELEDNPLGGTLIVQAESIEDYNLVLEILNSKELGPYIQEKNFQDYNIIVSRITDISRTINRIGLFLSIIFLSIAVLTTFNTIRVAIYTHREELGIMRLVGASKAFIEWPFIIEGMFYALIAVSVNTAIIYPIITAIQPFLSDFFGSNTLNLVSYFNNNFIRLIGLELAGAAFITIVSSWLAVRKYIRE